MEFPYLQKLSKSLNPEETMIVSLCTVSDMKAIQKFLRETLPGETPNFPTMVNGYKTFKAFRSRGYPSNFILDKEGTIRFFHWGLYEGNIKRFQTEMEALAAEK
jgi:hypothetical protein